MEASAVERDHEEVQSELSVEASSDTEDAEHESEYDRSLKVNNKW